MINRSTLFLIFLLTLTGLQHADAQVIWDSSFNGTGSTTRMYYDGSPTVLPIGLNAKMHLLTSTGKIIAAGTVDGYYSGYAFGYQANGAIDPAVGSMDMVNIPVSNDNMRMTATAGDTIFVLGKGVDWSSGEEFVTVTKMDTLGNLASDFGTGGQIQVPILMSGWNYGCTPLAIAVQADGKIVIAANANILFATSEILRFMPNGAVDPTFGTGGVVTLYIASCGYTVNSIFTLPGGKILITGDFRHVGSTEYFSACRFLNNGNFDSTFADSGYVYNLLDFDGYVHASVLQPDGKVVVGGTEAIRYNTDGSVDATFGASGVYYPPVIITAMQQDAAGRTYMLGSNYTNNLWRITPDGNTDAAFNGTGMYSFSFGSAVNDTRSLSLYPQGKILMYGDYRDPDYNYHMFLARVDIRPIVENAGAPPPYCAGDAAQLYCHATGSISWYNGATLLPDTGKLITVLTSGSYTAVATIGGVADTSDTTTLTFNPLPVAGALSGTDSVCATSSVTLTASATGGSWSASNTHATVAGGLITGVTAGTDSVIYTVTNSCGAATAVEVVNVLPMPDAGMITGAANACAGSSLTLASTSPGGTWSLSNTTIASVGATTGIVTSMAAGADTIHYTSSNSCGTATAAYVVSIDPMPAAIAGISPLCTGDTIMLSDATTGGTWATSNSAVATVNAGTVTGIIPGAVTITYTTPAGCNTTAVVTVGHCVTEMLQPLAQANHITIFPNPASNTLSVTATDIITEVAITNNTGQLIYTCSYNARNAAIDLSQMPPGIYFIRVNNTDVQKFVKE